jgi:hypothetical protein
MACELYRPYQKTDTKRNFGKQLYIRIVLVGFTIFTGHVDPYGE